MSDGSPPAPRDAGTNARSASAQQFAAASSSTALPTRPATATDANVSPSLPPWVTLRDPKHRKPVPQRPATAVGQASPPLARPNLTIRVYPYQTEIDLGRRPLATPGMNAPPRDPSWWDPANHAVTPGQKYPREAKPQFPAANPPSTTPGDLKNVTAEEPALNPPCTPMVSLEEARARKDIRLRGFDTPMPPTPCNDVCPPHSVKKMARDFWDFFR